MFRYFFLTFPIHTKNERNKNYFVFLRIMSLMVLKSGRSVIETDQHRLSKSIISFEQISFSNEGRNPNLALSKISKQHLLD